MDLGPKPMVEEEKWLLQLSSIINTQTTWHKLTPTHNTHTLPVHTEKETIQPYGKKEDERKQL